VQNFTNFGCLPFGCIDHGHTTSFTREVGQCTNVLSTSQFLSQHAYNDTGKEV
jgi:hypothetical protein